MQEWKNKLASQNDFSETALEQAFKAFLEEKSLGLGAVLPLFRLLITGKGMGPNMFSICALLGKENCLKRMETGLEKLAIHSA